MILKGLLTDSKLISRCIFNNNTMIGMVRRDYLIMTLIMPFNNRFRIKVIQEKGKPRSTIKETNLEAGDPLLAPVRTKGMFPTTIRM